MPGVTGALQDLADTVKRLRLSTNSARELLEQADQFHGRGLRA